MSLEESTAALMRSSALLGSTPRVTSSRGRGGRGGGRGGRRKTATTPDAATAPPDTAAAAAANGTVDGDRELKQMMQEQRVLARTMIAQKSRRDAFNASTTIASLSSKQAALEAVNRGVATSTSVVRSTLLDMPFSVAETPRYSGEPFAVVSLDIRQQQASSAKALLEHHRAIRSLVSDILLTTTSSSRECRIPTIEWRDDAPAEPWPSWPAAGECRG